jgi:hypothetical protein
MYVKDIKDLNSKELFKYDVKEKTANELPECPENLDDVTFDSLNVMLAEEVEKRHEFEVKYYEALERYVTALEYIAQHPLVSQVEYDELVKKMDKIEKENKKISIALNCDGYQD